MQLDHGRMVCPWHEAVPALLSMSPQFEVKRLEEGGLGKIA
jgi:hypothetical protein